MTSWNCYFRTGLFPRMLERPVLGFFNYTLDHSTCLDQLNNFMKLKIVLIHLVERSGNSTILHANQ